MRNTADKTGDKVIAGQSEYISGVNTVNPLVAFYNIHGKKGFHCSVPYKIRDTKRKLSKFDYR
jgi:hypothetical protein